jgi:hypothetical protein
MTSILALMGIGIFAIPAALLASAFSDELVKERDLLKAKLFGILKDGHISDAEAAIIRSEAKRLHLTIEEVNQLIEVVIKEHELEERNPLPIHKIAENPALAVEHYKVLLGQIRQLGVQVDNAQFDQAAQHGLEDIQFLVAGHAGSTPRPVGKVASGGELSRIALAIAVTTSELGEAGTLIFDEVDSGVGGAVAETVGRLMKQLGVHRQVLAVTHLPQVASCADHHLLVSKSSSKEGVSSSVTPIAGEQRVTEIARMLGGEKLSATTLAHAREMLTK